MELGGVYAFVGVRGGDDYGEEWARAGAAGRRENAIRDYLAAIDWLIKSGYTAPGRIVAISVGGSVTIPAGAVNRRPELFAAVSFGSPMLDLLGLERLAGGSQWTELLGSSSDETQTAGLRTVSPYQNIRPGACYPAMLIIASELDSVAHPSHAYKYAAAVQEAQQCPGQERPILLQVRWGHGFNGFGVNPLEQLAFFAHVLQLPV